ncbi:MAG: hypothetical protein FWD31_04115, partial [Planctomycetaceae bacterium]|nr:hypothetical protein [Planctomycetaceae bacterium]
FLQRSPRMALDHRSLRWFAACLCRPTARGLPSSHAHMARRTVVRKSDGVILATAETNWAFVSTETRRPMKIPQEVCACFIPVGEEVTGLV